VELGKSGPTFFILFVIVPWIGVMMAGYAFGAVMQMRPDRRRRICLRLGLALSALFILLRAVDVYGDPRPWQLLGFAGYFRVAVNSSAMWRGLALL
jgi:uncharacterized membrane protein